MTVHERRPRSELAAVLEPLADELVAVRHDLHAHPELSRQEFRTTKVVADRLFRDGLRPMLLPGGTGLVCDVGDVEGAAVRPPTVLLRADLDALPLTETADVPYRSVTPGVAHACGHDVHTAALLGAGLALHDLHRRGELAGAVRLIFQPAEEVHPGGALTVVEAGALEGVDRAFALHCDPAEDVGRVGVRAGAVTSAVDVVTVRLHGAGGHTSRPHLTEDVVFALAQVAVQVPAVLSRRVDPRAGASLVWGAIHAGKAANAVPGLGELRGTLRCLDAQVWAGCGDLVAQVVHEVVRPYGVVAEVDHRRGVPPTVNDPDAVALVERAVRRELGDDALVPTAQSLGGEDFGWVLERVPGAMLRLGTRTVGGPTHDLHQPEFTADDAAVLVGAMTLAGVALADLAERAVPPFVPEPVPDVLVLPDGGGGCPATVLDVDEPPYIDTWTRAETWSARHL